MAVPNEKVVWLTLDSKLSFVGKLNKWDGTKMVFEISGQEDRTRLHITHVGLVPALHCFDSCSKRWSYYLQNSLLPLITTGKGKPDPKDK